QAHRSRHPHRGGERERHDAQHGPDVAGRTAMTTAAQRTTMVTTPFGEVGGGLLGAIYIVWWRDIIRYWRDRARVGASLAQPLLYLVIFRSGLPSSLGGGFGATTPGGAGVAYSQFICPVVISWPLLFTPIFGAMPTS